MRIRQYVYFGLRSRRRSASDIGERLRFEPDEVLVRASRSVQPPRPASHAWRVVCREPGLTVDEQIARVISRLAPLARRIGELAAALRRSEGEHGGATLQVVRYLDAENGEPEEFVRTAGGLEKLPGQHQLLGWHLDHATLDFLRLTNADLDVDEYG